MYLIERVHSNCSRSVLRYLVNNGDYAVIFNPTKFILFTSHSL